MFVRRFWMVVLAMLVVMGCSSAQPTQGGGEPISKVQQAVCSRKWTGVSAGYDHTCATTNDGRLYCWGHNNVGQVSSTLDEEVLSPIMIFNGITGGTGMVVDQVSTAANHTCALVSEYPPSSYSRNLWCWGDNTDKTVGDPNHNPVWSPYHVVTGIVTPVKNVAVGIGNTCIVDANDDLRCWGKRDYCQTGTQSGTPTITPTLAPTMYQGDTWPNTAKQVSVQFSTVCGVGLDDTPRCWGSNTYGNFGSGSGGGYSCTPVSPTSLPFDDSVRDVQVGAGFTCWSDLNDSYLPYCAGHNYYAQLGRGSQTTTSPYYLSTPAAVSDYWLDEGIPLLQLGAGYGFNAVALAEGYVYTWGYGLYGANGDGSTNVRLRPEMVVVGGYPIYTPQVSAGANYDCAISSDGTELWCWGLNSHGQLGDGTTTNRTTPITIACP